MDVILPDIQADGGDLVFLLGILFNQRVRSEVAWQAPVRLAERMGSCDPWELATADENALAGIIMHSPALHPWSATMARNVIRTCMILVRDYEGKARSLWSDSPTGQELLTRLISFPGIGRHKAQVAIALLMLEYGIAIGGDGPALAAEALASCPRLADVVGLPTATERIGHAVTHRVLRR